MIDANSPDTGQPQTNSSRSGSSVAGVSRGDSQDLYADLFSGNEAQDSNWAASVIEAVSGTCTGRVSPPAAPTSLKECGLKLMQICELILKQLYLQGNLQGAELARHARLPFKIVEEALQLLKDEKCIEVASGELIGPVSYRYNLTELGRRRAGEAFEQCRYVGPAPVPLEAYVQQCRLQTVAGIACTPAALRKAFADLILRPSMLEELGPAVCSGKSIFLYGPPGNGKTMIGKGLGRFLNTRGGEIYVPYAIEAENSIIAVFDPTLHQATDQADDLAVLAAESSGDPASAITQMNTASEADHRWRRIRRPVVITGGELTLEMLDLRYNSDSNFYTAPLHIKANCGVFLIDDFGRQLVGPRELLNRWIVPLEERIDYLTLATGKKFSVPFEQLTIFSTNLDPKELVDEAFLRRIRHKIQIGPPSREIYTEIFQRGCEQRRIEFNASFVDFLYSQFYDNGRTPRASDPRDLLEIIQAICRFRSQKVLLTPELMEEASKRFFAQVGVES